MPSTFVWTVKVTALHRHLHASRDAWKVFSCIPGRAEQTIRNSGSWLVYVQCGPRTALIRVGPHRPLARELRSRTHDASARMAAR